MRLRVELLEKKKKMFEKHCLDQQVDDFKN